MLKVGTLSSSKSKNFIVNFKDSLIGGIWGYILFLGILMLTKVISGYILSNGEFTIETPDFILPVIGFILLFLIKYLENYKED